jgi:DNA-binding CsgD family transcriptional regulator
MTDDDWLGLGARVRLLEALVALAGREFDEALQSLDEAITDMRRVEHPWDEADAHYLFGTVLRDVGEPALAAKHFSEALAIYERISAAEPFIARVLAAWPSGIDGPRKANGDASRSPRENGSALSEREAEVLRLLVQGHSNRRIAETLVISEPTVATHIRHILEKTGTANRTEAAAWAVREGLV